MTITLSDWFSRLFAVRRPPVDPPPPSLTVPTWANEPTLAYCEPIRTLGQRTCYGTTGRNQRR